MSWQRCSHIILLKYFHIIMITMIIVACSLRVLAEMEGWEGIGQEELAALRHQVCKTKIIIRTFLWHTSVCGTRFAKHKSLSELFCGIPVFVAPGLQNKNQYQNFFGA